MKAALVLIAAFLMTGCAQLTGLIKPSADVAVAAAQFPLCRAALESYLPEEVEAEIADDWLLLDSTFEGLTRAVQREANITLVDALNRALNSSETADELGAAFARIEAATLEYKAESGNDTSSTLKGCNTMVKSGWKGIRENEGAVLARDFLQVYGPYAKTLLLLL